MTAAEPIHRPVHLQDQPPRYAVCGMGLMGGSLCYALRHYVPGCQVVGVEVDPVRRQEAEQLGLADQLLDGVDRLDAATFDVVFLATPVSTIADLAIRLGEGAGGPAILVDLGSVKGTVVRNLDGKLPEGVSFFGGHPMTGSALEGLEGADPHLYENAVFVLCPLEGADVEASRVVEDVLLRIGAILQQMTPTLHDDSVSTISHLPYLLAVAMMEVLQDRHGEDGGRAAEIAAGGFHGATRVATCTPSVFRDIVMANRIALLQDIRVLQERLSSFAASLESEDGEDLRVRFRSAQVLRRRLPQLRKGILPKLPEAIIKARDQPGFIGQVATMIGAAQVNIRDLEVLHSREGEGGTLRIAFETTEGRTRALRILDAAGFVGSERDD